MCIMPSGMENASIKDVATVANISNRGLKNGKQIHHRAYLVPSKRYKVFSSLEVETISWQKVAWEWTLKSGGNSGERHFRKRGNNKSLV